MEGAMAHFVPVAKVSDIGDVESEDAPTYLIQLQGDTVLLSL